MSRLVAAVDAGRIVNPGLVRQQIEGGLLAALAAAVVPAPEYIAGHAAGGADARPRLRAAARSAEDRGRDDRAATRSPGGISGLGMAVLAPAVANALAAGTGRRLRNLPFDPMSAA